MLETPQKGLHPTHHGELSDVSDNMETFIETLREGYYGNKFCFCNRPEGEKLQAFVGIMSSN